MCKLTKSVEILSANEYHTKVRFPFYSGKISIDQTHSERDGANILIKLKPELTRCDHVRKATTHLELADFHNAEWTRVFEEAAKQTFGRPSQFGDYKVSAIGSSDFSEEHKQALRLHAHSKGKHQWLHLCHSAAATSRKLH